MTAIADGVETETPPSSTAASRPEPDRNSLGLFELLRRRPDDVARWTLIGAMAMVVLLVWLPSLTWGFIYDEHITAWVTQDGLREAIGRAQEHQGNSPLYFGIIWAVRQVAGASTITLRLPSVVALIVAAFHLTRLGQEVHRRETGLIAAFVLIANGHTLIRGVTARPYGLLLLLLVVSMRYLLRYLWTGRLRWGLVWILTAVACLYMTPFAAAMLAPHAVVLWHDAGYRRVPQRQLSGLIAIGILLALPLSPQVLDLASRSESLVVSQQPSIETLAQFMVPSIGLLAVLIGFTVGGTSDLGAHASESHRTLSWRVAITWAVVPIFLLYLAGVVGTPIVGVSRYRLGALPGAALVVGLLLNRLRRPTGYLLAVGALVMLSLLQLSTHTNEREWWREATEWAMEQMEGRDAVMAYDFALVEELDVAQVADPHFADYFTAPAHAYGVEHPVHPLPIGETPEAAAYLDTLFVELTDHEMIALVTNYRTRAPDYRDVFAERLVSLGYTEIPGPTYRLVAASVYVRNTP